MPKKASSLEIHLLGPFRIFVDGQAIEERQFTRRKPKQLIKLLALQPHHQLLREQAMDFFGRIQIRNCRRTTCTKRFTWRAMRWNHHSNQLLIRTSS